MLQRTREGRESHSINANANFVMGLGGGANNERPNDDVCWWWVCCRTGKRGGSPTTERKTVVVVCVGEGGRGHAHITFIDKTKGTNNSNAI